MKFVSIEKKKKRICHTHLYLKDKEWHERSEKSPEVPLASLPVALQALSQVVCEIMSFPKEQHGQMIPYKFKVTETEEGTRSFQIGFNHIYEQLGTERLESTPIFRIDKPSGSESGVVVLDKKYLDLVGTAIHEAERYITGDRQQMTLEEYANKDEVITPQEDESDLTLES